MFNFISSAIQSVSQGVSQAFKGLVEVRRGLNTVAMHSWREPTTQAYPDVMPDLPPHFRGRLALTVNPESGENLCISCRQCERVCPDKCIEITANKSTETNKLELIDFKIDHGLCMFCGLCTEVCPTYCIINTNDFEMADYTRGALIYDLKKLTLTQEESAYYFAAKEMPLPKPKPVKSAAPAGETKPAVANTSAVATATAVKAPAPDATKTPASDAAKTTTPASAPAPPTSEATAPAENKSAPTAKESGEAIKTEAAETKSEAKEKPSDDGSLEVN